MAHRFRIGNDLYIRWHISLRNGGVYDLSDKTFSIYVFSGDTRVDIDSISVEDGYVELLFPGDKQERTGTYSLRYKESGKMIDERNVFTLVPESWMEDQGEIDESGVVVVMTAFGTPGSKGEKGDKGDKGDTGAAGANGRDGIDGINGVAGQPGKSIRVTVWGEDIDYYAGDEEVDGVTYLDIVSDKDAAIGTEDVHYYMCKCSHRSSVSIPLTNADFWSPMDNTAPLVTPLILSEKIKANLIDTNDLVANQAFVQTLAADNTFINNLYVTHLNGATGDFTGRITANGGSITGDLQIDGGSLYNINGQYYTTIAGSSIEFSDQQPLSQSHAVSNCKLDINDGIKTEYKQVGNSGTSVHSASLRDSVLTLTRQMDARGSYSDIYGSHTASGGTITSVIGSGAYNITTPTAEMSAVKTLKDGGCEYIMKATGQEFADMSEHISNVLYIVTDGENKGVWIGNTKVV